MKERLLPILLIENQTQGIQKSIPLTIFNGLIRPSKMTRFTITRIKFGLYK